MERVKSEDEINIIHKCKHFWGEFSKIVHTDCTQHSVAASFHKIFEAHSE